MSCRAESSERGIFQPPLKASRGEGGVLHCFLTSLWIADAIPLLRWLEDPSVAGHAAHAPLLQDDMFENVWVGVKK